MKTSEIRQHLNRTQKVILDKGYANESIVEVVIQSHDKLYTMVKDGDDEWTVMTNRLTEIDTEEPFHGDNF